MKMVDLRENGDVKEAVKEVASLYELLDKKLITSDELDHKAYEIFSKFAQPGTPEYAKLVYLVTEKI